MATKRQALLVEDDRNIIDLLALHLRDLGITADAAETGTEGLKKAQSGEYDLIVLDLMLPGVDGLGICRAIREKDRSVPILMVTARSDEVDKVLGLELGADDYITKPFSPREFLARVKAVMRRSAEMSAGGETTPGTAATGSPGPGGVFIDERKRRVYVEGNEVELTTKEFDLLLLLASHPGQAFNREQLLERVWGYHHEGYNHTVNSHINRLRAKIEPDPDRPRYVKTVWGAGYKFEP